MFFLPHDEKYCAILCYRFDDCFPVCFFSLFITQLRLFILKYLIIVKDFYICF